MLFENDEIYTASNTEKDSMFGTDNRSVDPIYSPALVRHDLKGLLKYRSRNLDSPKDRDQHAMPDTLATPLHYRHRQ
jgi:hypothetical protein